MVGSDPAAPAEGGMTAPDYDPAATEARLRELFPRGRFTRQADQMPILVARAKRLAGCHVYEQAPGRLLGLFYVGSARRWLKLLGDLVVQRLGGDGEGILYVRWCPEAAAKLGMFSLRRQSEMPLGRRFGTRVADGNGPRSDERPSDAPAAGPTAARRP